MKIASARVQCRERLLTDVVLATIEDDLVAPLTAPNLLQRVNDLQPELPALHRLGHRNVLDVTDKTRRPDELAFHKDGPASDNLTMLDSRENRRIDPLCL